MRADHGAKRHVSEHDESSFGERRTFFVGTCARSGHKVRRFLGSTLDSAY